VKKFSLLRALALLLALSILGSACGSSSTTAASVNDATISKSDIIDELKALIGAVDKVPEDVLPAADRDNLLKGLLDADRKLPSAESAANLLTNKIISRLVEQSLVKYNLTVEDQDTQASTADIESSLYNYVAPKYRDAAIAEGARTSRLSRFLEDTDHVWYTDADVAAFYEMGKKDRFLGEACTAHILVADEALAKELLKQIKDGADFAAVAAANSTDASNKDRGGDLGCNAKGAFVPEFEAAVANAKDGDLIGPVKTDYGYHIIKVTTSYKERALDDALKTEIGTQLAQPRGWLDYTLGQTKITVNRQFGTWDPVETKVVPPVGATPAATTTVAPQEQLPAGTGATATGSTGSTGSTGASATTGATGSTGASATTGATAATGASGK
jgi:parvulin-like peptidyl-prolyl isomerase